MVKILHIAAVELFTAYTLFKTVSLWLGKAPRKELLLSRVALVLILSGFAAGIYLYAYHYNFYTPAWLRWKFILIGISIVSGLTASVKQNKWLFLLSFSCNLSVIIIANQKFY